MSPKRGTISVSRALYDRLRAFTEERGISMAGLVEDLLEPVLSGHDAAPSTAPEGLPASPLAPDPPEARRRMKFDRALLDRIAADRKALGLVAAAVPRVSATSNVALDIPAHVSTALFDQLARARADGQEIGPGQLLDAAIARMLDALEGRPWCRRCLVTIEDCRCSARQAQEDVLARYKETPIP